MKEVYQLTKEELYEVYVREKTQEKDKETNISFDGLCSETAKKRLEQHGPNILKETGKKSVFRIFLSQFADLLVVILIAAAVISMFSGNMESTVVILVVIVLNAVLGTVQYVKAEKSLDALKKLSAPKVKVLRDGRKTEIPASDVVVGDVCLLEAGDMIGADARVLESFSLQVNESALTGESTSVDKEASVLEKEVPLGDRKNMVFLGSLVTYGRGNVLVTGTGMQTQMGKIATLMNDTKNRKTPLQVSLDDFSKKLALIVMFISAVVFGLRIWQREVLLDSLMFAVALAVAAIPEALSSIVTIVQAMGTSKMAAEGAIIKDLKAVESLGCVSVICSDKTGTLTQNKMTAMEVYVDGRCITPEEMDLSNRLHRNFLYNAILNNDAAILEGKDIGDPTETCLLNMARRAGLMEKGATEEDIRALMPRMEEIPFDSDRKLMSTKYLIHGKPMVLTKGAVDVLLDRVDYVDTADGKRRITKEDAEDICAQNARFSENGLRVLAFAYKECEEGELLTKDMEYGYTFVGLVSMMDPPREESMQAVADAIRAGIRPVMITGDHKVTATAIARQIGIFKEGDMALTGQELDGLSEEELQDVLSSVSVYARVSPENKIRIVEAWQKKGHVVSMTGDGVNDAPALKKADIGVAMGITGTEVSKDAAAMILSDDNFATIIKAVLNGRNVYRNIMNAILFLLSGNMAAIIVVVFCSLFALPTPFEPVHLLFINLLTDSLPALAIGMEPSDTSLLNRPPRDPKQGILTKAFLRKVMLYGVMIAVVTQVAFYMGLGKGAHGASTMAFATLTLARLFHGFNCRSEKDLWYLGIWSNKWSVAAFVTGVVLLLAVFVVPVLSRLFMVTEVLVAEFCMVLLLAVLPTLAVQLVRVVRR